MRLGYPGTGRADGAPAGVNCHWTDYGPAAQLTMTLVTGKNALAEAYQAPAVDFAYFLPYEVEGMPAVLRAEKPGRSSTCGAVIGVAADQGVVVEYQESVASDRACERASAAAAAIAANIKS